MKLLIRFIFLLTFFSHCNKINPLSEMPAFTGLTGTDNYGMKLSDDPTDWTFTDKWSTKEAGLFQSSYQTTCSPDASCEILVYPNPNHGVFTVSVKKPSGAKLEIRLVDKNFKTLIANDEIVSSTVQLNASTFGIKGVVRLYYKLIDNNCEFRGHGDVKIQ